MCGLRLRRRVEINCKELRITAPLFVLALTLGLSQVNATLAAEPDPLPVSKSITRAELKNAVEKGETIIGREIDGEDIVAVLRTWITSDSKCLPNAGLRIEKGVIRGDVKLDFKTSPSKPTAQDPDEEDTDNTKTDDTTGGPERWLSIPLLIKESIVNDRFQLDSLGVACPMDLSRSTFESGIDIRSATFQANVSAVGAEFKTGAAILGSEFKSNTSFWRAKFVGNLEFTRMIRRKSTFEGNADFREAVFSRQASFINTMFMNRMDFRNVQFVSGVSFSGATLASTGVVGPASGPFYGTEFGGFANFRTAHFTGLRFLRSTFRAGADFRGASGKRLQFYGVAFSGRLGFDDARSIRELEFNNFGGSMIVDGEAVFRRAAFDKLIFIRTAFKNSVDFQSCEVRSSLKFRTVSFDGDLHFEDVKLPGMGPNADESGDEGNSEINIEDITLNRGLYIDAKQFLVRPPWWAVWREDTPRLYANDRRTRDDRRVWRQLVRAFDLAQNVELKNYAEYKLRVSEEIGQGSEDEPFAKITSVASRWFWGYGLRPLRVLFWFVVTVLVFSGIYWTQLPNPAGGKGPVSRSVARASTALMFSVRTAWELKYGYSNSTNVLFRSITVIESIIAKLLLASFAYALTQASPLLSDLMKKLLP